ncbi:type I-F CRISPR-associated protein Csy2 [Oceanisphaera arctica]|uniref:Type I-F CRISPR-associated protein Csy2 n=1 Tax=Oceanisphaera arctica TaxID=641510 RepID=A0A2P5TIP6_9GAMM|nr:type I-F CRISPR-associated protein Csy2 [Oceanisphaera arctica]PPL14584.1 type I-F CRISPR-associated protein Csy2 [Oceanisphaera arctica]GHA17802.1 CRISPR type I-F system protein Csy2 [Oceanisphaera arctica]
MSTRRLLVLPHLNIHNANALSSPYTIGFPAMTAWLGFVHALERKLQAAGYPTLKLVATGVFSHRCDLQTYQGPGDFVHSIIGTANPLDKDGKRSAFIEEARCHLDVSLLIEYRAAASELDRVERPEFIQLLDRLLNRMKVAGGDLLGFNEPKMTAVDDRDDKAVRSLILSLMPGFALIERRELMQQAMAEGADALDALLEHLTIHHSCTQDESDQVTWHRQRKVGNEGEKLGWIVPIATGFQGISELGEAKNQRDSDTPHRFAESVVTLGEFKMAHRIRHLDEVLWHYHADLGSNLYLCQQAQLETTTNNDGFY